MNFRRINVLLAIAAILSASIAAEAMIPRQKLVNAVSQDELEAMIPTSFGHWTFVPGTKMVEPQGSDTLSKQIYSAEVSRGYRDSDGHFIMLVVAYGPSQSDRLQLHRPEICYAAQGFRVSRPQSDILAFEKATASLPVRLLVAQRENRLEPITYWMRLGDAVATGAVHRQFLKVAYGMRGYIVDGALVRISTTGLPQGAAFAIERTFVSDLLHAVNPATRRFLIGSNQ